MNSKKTGAFIAELRKEKGLTQRELAQLLNMSDKTVSKWETGEGYPEITIFPGLALALDVTTDELFKGERIPPVVVEKIVNQPPKQLDYLGLSAVVLRTVTYLAIVLLIPASIFYPLILVGGAAFYIPFGVFNYFLAKAPEDEQDGILKIINSLHRPIVIFHLVFFFDIIFFLMLLFLPLAANEIHPLIPVIMAGFLAWALTNYVTQRLGYVEIREKIYRKREPNHKW